MDALVGQCAGAFVILDRDLEREFEERLKDSSALAFRLAYAVLLAFLAEMMRMRWPRSM